MLGAPRWSITHQHHSFASSSPPTNVPSFILEAVLGSWGERPVKIAKKPGKRRWGKEAVGQEPLGREHLVEGASRDVSSSIE